MYPLPKRVRSSPPGQLIRLCTIDLRRHLASFFSFQEFFSYIEKFSRRCYRVLCMTIFSTDLDWMLGWLLHRCAVRSSKLSGA